MKLSIDSNQFVSVDSNGNVRFHHHVARNLTHVLTIKLHQFLNLNDVMDGMKYYRRLTWYPLGGDVWVYMNHFVKLVDNRQGIFFRFYETGWEEYKSNVHPHILLFLHYVCCGSHHKSHARDASGSKSSFGGRLSSLRRGNKILSRAARNASDANENERAKFTNLSRRKSANSWSHLGRRSGRNASRIHHEIEEAKEDGELSGYESDTSELGCEPSVTIED